jgi:hypothetical protein
MLDKDDRLNSYCVTAKCTYEHFLNMTEGSEGNLQIQRSIIKGAKAYATLRSDLKRGCVLPAIVLAASTELQGGAEQFLRAGGMNELSVILSGLAAEDVYIIDGLQRTNAIRQTAISLGGEEKEVFLAREIRLEIWLNIPFGAIAYRMLLLNAGQRPMSVKHQVEVLSSKLVDDLQSVRNLTIFRNGEGRRRVQPGQFQLAKLAQAFQAWLQGQPNLDLRNAVMEELLAESAIEVLGYNISDSSAPRVVGEDGFNQLVTWMVELDLALGDDNLQFLGNETVLLGLSAAVGAMERNASLADRVWPALNQLLDQVRAEPGNALALEVYENLRQGIDAGKANVGAATRDMVYSAFKEFIRGAAETHMSECWKIGAARN